MMNPVAVSDTQTLIEMLSLISTALSAIASAAAVFVAYRVYVGQKLLAQRQLLVPLWQYMSDLNEINPAKPITPDVVKAANTLELVALCCEGGMVDPQVIRRTFRDVFLSEYRMIRSCGELPGLDVTGQELLGKTRAATSLYHELYEEDLNKDRITPHV